jgi:5-methylcytosine-specific restriction endonuclease McrA
VQSFSLTHLSDSALDHALESAARDESRATAWLLAHLAEFEARRRFAPAGYPSMFEYCVRHLRFSEDAAYTRIRVARAARRFPVIFRMIAERRLHLTAVRLLGPHLTTANAAELLEAATGRCKTEIEELLAARFPRPDLPELVMALSGASSTVKEMHTQLVPEPVGMTKPEQVLAPAPNFGAEVPTPETVENTMRPLPVPEPRPRVTPLAPQRYGLQVTVSQGTYDKLQRARDLLRHRVPGGELEQVLDRALDALIEQLEKRKHAATDRPQRTRTQATSPNPRHIPAAIKRAVWKRDRGQCTFVAATGRRCEARGHLEFDHVEPVARGGRSTAGNLRLRCRAHNQFEADRAYGAGFMDAKWDAARQRSGPVLLRPKWLPQLPGIG